MKYYAELGTDKYIRENFFPDFSYNGTMIECGSGPPEWISMSKHFRDNGWRCICIDPNPKFVEQHQKVNNEIYQIACSNVEKDSTFKIIVHDHFQTSDLIDYDGVSISALEIKYAKRDLPVIEIPVKVRKLNSLLEELNVEHVDFLSVDTEGWELEVMMGFDVNKYKPKVILLENYLYDAKYTSYMSNIGYELKHNIQYNYIYIKK